MICLISTLYVLSVLLPVARLIWLFVESRRASGEYASATTTADGAGVSFDQFNVLVKQLGAAQKARVWSAVADVGFVGAGVGLAGVASLLALTLTGAA